MGSRVPIQFASPSAECKPPTANKHRERLHPDLTTITRRVFATPHPTTGDTVVLTALGDAATHISRDAERLKHITFEYNHCGWAELVSDAPTLSVFQPGVVLRDVFGFFLFDPKHLSGSHIACSAPNTPTSTVSCASTSRSSEGEADWGLLSENLTPLAYQSPLAPRKSSDLVFGVVYCLVQSAGDPQCRIAAMLLELSLNHGTYREMQEISIRTDVHWAWTEMSLNRCPTYNACQASACEIVSMILSWRTKGDVMKCELARVVVTPTGLYVVDHGVKLIGSPARSLSTCYVVMNRNQMEDQMQSCHRGIDQPNVGFYKNGEEWDSVTPAEMVAVPSVSPLDVVVLGPPYLVASPNPEEYEGHNFESLFAHPPVSPTTPPRAAGFTQITAFGVHVLRMSDEKEVTRTLCGVVDWALPLNSIEELNVHDVTSTESGSLLAVVSIQTVITPTMRGTNIETDDGPRVPRRFRLEPFATKGGSPTNVIITHGDRSAATEQRVTHFIVVEITGKDVLFHQDAVLRLNGVCQSAVLRGNRLLLSMLEKRPTTVPGVTDTFRIFTWNLEPYDSVVAPSFGFPEAVPAWKPSLGREYHISIGRSARVFLVCDYEGEKWQRNRKILHLLYDVVHVWHAYRSPARWTIMHAIRESDEEENNYENEQNTTFLLSSVS